MIKDFENRISKLENKNILLEEEVKEMKQYLEDLDKIYIPDRI